MIAEVSSQASSYGKLQSIFGACDRNGTARFTLAGSGPVQANGSAPLDGCTGCRFSGVGFLAAGGSTTAAVGRYACALGSSGALIAATKSRIGVRKIQAVTNPTAPSAIKANKRRFIQPTITRFDTYYKLTRDKHERHLRSR